jgi:Rieske Fe-S protein
MEINRRHFLCGAMLTAVGATSSMVGEAAHAASAKGVKQLPNGTLEVTPASIKALGKVGGVALIGDVNGAPVALVRASSKRYVALDLRCTHAQVPVKPASGGFYCEPSKGGHGSAFTRTGNVSQGPADAPLSSLPVAIKGKKIIVG